MDNLNLESQNNQQIDQTASQPLMPLEKPRRNYSLIIGIVLGWLVVLGFGGYYLSKQPSTSPNKFKQAQPATPPIITEENEVSNLKTYKNTQREIEFEYPPNYTVSTATDCSLLAGNQSECLVSLTLSPTESEYTPKAHFGLLKGVNSINIAGQTDTINFDSQKKAWVISGQEPTPEVLSIWDHTKSGQEIIKASNGNSHGSSHYYIIPNYKNDEVAIFSIPESFRLRCDLLDKDKETDCNNFYKSVIEQYNNGETTVDTWLPENYLNSIYSEAENIVRSYRTMVR